MKKILLALAAVMAVFFFFALRSRCPRDVPAKPERAPAAQPVARTPAIAAPREATPVAVRDTESADVEGTQWTERAEEGKSPESRDAAVSTGDVPDVTPEQALEVLRVTFKNFGQRFKGNPVGNNAEITAALNGNNPGQARYLGETPNLNDKGELLDGWGTPYFFHQLGGYDMEIHSAGPDRKMWTRDDLVAR